MPLTDLHQMLMQSPTGAGFFASDEATARRIMITMTSEFMARHRDGPTTRAVEDFRAFALEAASEIYDRRPHAVYVVLDGEAPDAPT